MKIRIVNHSKHPLPAYETAGSAGMDLRANLDADILLKPFGNIAFSNSIVGNGL